MLAPKAKIHLPLNHKGEKMRQDLADRQGPTNHTQIAQDMRRNRFGSQKPRNKKATHLKKCA